LFAGQQFYESFAPEDRPHSDGGVGGSLDNADDLGMFAEGVLPQEVAGALRLGSGHDRDHLALIGNIERIQSQGFAKAADAGGDGQPVFVDQQ